MKTDNTDNTVTLSQLEVGGWYSSRFPLSVFTHANYLHTNDPSDISMLEAGQGFMLLEKIAGEVPKTIFTFRLLCEDGRVYYRPVYTETVNLHFEKIC